MKRFGCSEKSNSKAGKSLFAELNTGSRKYIDSLSTCGFVRLAQ
jgi:hypothetical protein